MSKIKIMQRRAKWAEANRGISDNLKHCDELTGLGLKQALQHYIREEKRDEDDSDDNVRQYGRIDPVVFEWTMEIDRRFEEDADLARELPSPATVLEIEQKTIKKELEKCFGGEEYGSRPALVLINRKGLDEENSISDDPARIYEDTIVQRLHRELGRELMVLTAPRRARVRPRQGDPDWTDSQDIVPEELDTPIVQKPSTGEYRDVVGSIRGMRLRPKPDILMKVAEQEILEAMKRLCPISDEELVMKHKEAFDEYLAKKEEK
jgi:hypothetical protein